MRRFPREESFSLYNTLERKIIISYSRTIYANYLRIESTNVETRLVAPACMQHSFISFSTDAPLLRFLDILISFGDCIVVLQMLLMALVTSAIMYCETFFATTCTLVVS